MATDTLAMSKPKSPASTGAKSDVGNGRELDGATEAGGIDDEESNKAAQVIQRNYRGYKSRREASGCGMSAGSRWVEAIKDAQYRNLTAIQSKRSQGGESGPTKWQRVTGVAARAGNDEDDNYEGDKYGSDIKTRSQDYYRKQLRSKQGEGENSKTMGLEYWLELVDNKHRYGSNLLKYHSVWTRSSTQENFFYWLDEGDGKHEDLENCSRKKLESQQLHYLSREQRYEYLVEVGNDGLLRWAKSGKKVTTNLISNESQKGHAGKGADDQDGLSGQVESESHVNDDLHNARGVIQGAGLTVPAPLAKLVEKNPDKAGWIFVVDTSFRIYIGIKESGGFQHSSFLHGSRVLSAGLMAIEDGQLRSISPHSGHYRPTAENFWTLVKCLEAEGVDMSQASVIGSYAMLLGAETYRDTVLQIQSYIDSFGAQKDTWLNPEKVQKQQEAIHDSESAAMEREHIKS